MGRKKTKLILNARQLDGLRRQIPAAKDEREKERLRVVLRAASGQHTLEDLARTAGRARATIQNWLLKYRASGISGLLERNTPPGAVSPITSPEVQAAMRAGIKSERWQSASEVAAWLKAEHGITRATKSIYYWLPKKAATK